MHTHYNVLIYKTATRFGPHWPIIREYSCTKQSVGHTVISSIGEIVSAGLTEAEIDTIVEAACRLIDKLLISPQLSILETAQYFGDDSMA